MSPAPGSAPGPAPRSAPGARVTVVVATRNRRPELLATLDRLTSLPERPSVIVVDNGSDDGTVSAARGRTGVAVVDLGVNLGATARNVGVALARTPYVAFADDDSWWAPGALDHAADVLDDHPRLALLMARILVGDEERIDPTCEQMASSPLTGRPGLPGPPLLGFIACGAVVRRAPFLDAGGFDDLLFFLGEEQVLALDLARAGWDLAYVPSVVAHHHPSAVRDRRARHRRRARNDLLSAWMRRPAGVVAARSLRLLADVRRPGSLGALVETAVRLPGALRRRRTVPVHLERQIRLLEALAALPAQV